MTNPKTMTYVGLGAAAVSCIVCIITTIVSLNCLANKDNKCAQVSGFTALTFCCLMASAAGVIMYNKRAA